MEQHDWDPRPWLESRLEERGFRSKVRGEFFMKDLRMYHWSPLSFISISHRPPVLIELYRGEKSGEG